MVAPTIDHPWPLLGKEGNDGVIFMYRGELKDHRIFGQNDNLIASGGI